MNALKVYAANSTKLEIEIQPMECTFDSTESGVQAYTAINPRGCSQQLFFSPSAQSQDDTVTNSRARDVRLRALTVVNNSHKKASLPPSSSPNTHSDPPTRTNRQVFFEAGLVITLAASVDIIAFDQRFTQLVWRRLVKALSASNSENL